MYLKMYSLHLGLSVSRRNKMKCLIWIDKVRSPLQGVPDVTQNIWEVFLEADNTHVFVPFTTKHWDQWRSFLNTVILAFRSHVNTVFFGLGKVVKNVRFPFWIVRENISNMLQAVYYSRTLFDYTLNNSFNVWCLPIIRYRMAAFPFCRSGILLTNEN